MSDIDARSCERCGHGEAHVDQGGYCNALILNLEGCGDTCGCRCVIDAIPPGQCYYSWPDDNSVRVHVCIERGDHAEHRCGVCGPSVTPPEVGAS
jgi:hypothetical protein